MNFLGNPHNQLAVIATYSADEFSAARKSSADAQEKGQETPQRDQKENGSRRRFSHQRQASSAVQSAKIRTGEATQAFFSDFIRLHSIFPKAPISYSTASKKALVEKYAILLTLDSLSTLLDMCNSELLDVVVEYSDQRHNAVQILPAPVKRSLISLRVGTKWVYSSLEHLSSITALIEKDPNVKNDQGIPLDVPLAEDLELNGFSGLKNHTFMNEQILLNQGEPFEELDMRIYDIFEDACKISESEVGAPPNKDASPVNSLSPVQNQVADQSYVEDKVEVPINDLIADPYETNLAESQSFASSSPKKLTNDSSEDGDSEDEQQNFLEFLYPVTRPSTNLNGNTSAYSQTAFPAHTTISGVPNSSQDPLVPSTKRLSGEFNSITPHQQATAISSASLFAFPGTDGGVSQFGLFGDPNTSLLGFSGTSGHTSAKSSLSAINPPPGFSSESSAFDLHRHNQQNNQSLFQPSNVFGFSSFDMSTQFPWKQREYVNGLSDGNLQVNGTAGLSDH
ncbi:15098_t:CDS:2 [Racocetra fulgida]|uniref:15098_t:CDS:1 n=1 Tax=Racocetra fulgida TaxID=60492 RepID=A0A9N9BXV3_9GLOM|nr:15098_t:CDS:2 [Racocetra fulgida]